jgi:hypothetical protein
MIYAYIHTYLPTYIHTYLHYIALHYITLHTYIHIYIYIYTYILYYIIYNIILYNIILYYIIVILHYFILYYIILYIHNQLDTPLWLCLVPCFGFIFDVHGHSPRINLQPLEKRFECVRYWFVLGVPARGFQDGAWFGWWSVLSI